MYQIRAGVLRFLNLLGKTTEVRRQYRWRNFEDNLSLMRHSELRVANAYDLTVYR